MLLLGFALVSALMLAAVGLVLWFARTRRAENSPPGSRALGTGEFAAARGSRHPRESDTRARSENTGVSTGR